MLTYPDFDPVAFSLGPLKVHWYGITYLAGFLGCYLAGLWRVKRSYATGWTAEQVGDLLFYVALGVVIGGRIGYTLFYAYTPQGQWLEWQNPLYIFQVWDGGMSFHGGLWRRAMDTAPRKETSISGYSFEASSEAEYTEAPASDTTTLASFNSGWRLMRSAASLSVSRLAVPLPIAINSAPCC